MKRKHTYRRSSSSVVLRTTDSSAEVDPEYKNLVLVTLGPCPAPPPNAPQAEAPRKIPRPTTAAPSRSPSIYPDLVLSCGGGTAAGRGAKMFYGAMVWDPWLIVSQIVCLQCLYYLTLGVLMALLVGTRVPLLTLLYFFDFATLTPLTPTGWCVIASFLLAAVASAGFMLYVIERAKKCLDFAATLYIIHLFICIVYGGWPPSVTWWVVNITGLTIMALLGEYLCIRREMKEIPISRLRASV